MENPEWFVRRLQDSDLIPKEVNRNATAAELYDVLENFERDKKNLIPLFWKCVFEKHIIEKYPTLKELKEKLYKKTGVRMESELEHERAVTSTGRVSGPVPTVTVQEPMLPGPRWTWRAGVGQHFRPGAFHPFRPNKLATLPVREDEQPGPSFDVTRPPRRGPSSLPTTTVQYPVTCGTLRGMLDPNRLERGKVPGKTKCILVDKDWYTPSEFERKGVKERCKNWKTSIHYNNLSLSKYNLNNGCLCKKPKTKKRNVL
ncbi:unnamed protein product [Knipowitschia caucasica]|uniref:SAND domain-containing protein n=1 Tax=Knipowitschia caucasica TaxID=637954 RepID=A0AAV2KJR7_KNICA